MFCRHCGNEMKDKAVVCTSCGNPVAEGIDFEPPTAPRWSWFTMFITIGIIALLLLIAIIAGL